MVISTPVLESSFIDGHFGILVNPRKKHETKKQHFLWHGINKTLFIHLSKRTNGNLWMIGPTLGAWLNYIEAATTPFV